jgi:hypothetical protein
VARAAGVPRPFAIAAWDGVLEYASAHEDRGSIAGLTAEWLSITIGCEEEEAKKLLRAMIEKGMVSRDPSRVVAWDKRQPGDPTAAERMKRMRDRKRATNGDASEPPNGSEATPNGDEGYGVTPVTDRNVVTTISEQNRTEEIETQKGTESLTAPATPPPDPSAATWAYLKLVIGGTDPGRVVGKWCREYGDGAVYEAACAFRRVNEENARAHPVSWIGGELSRSAGRAGSKSPMGSYQRVAAKFADGADAAQPTESERRALALMHVEGSA